MDISRFLLLLSFAVELRLAINLTVSCSVRVENLQTVHTGRQELHLWPFG